MLTRLPFNRRRTTREHVYLFILSYPVFCSSEVDLDPMTLMYELDLDILKTYQKWSSSSFLLKVRALTRQTDRQIPAADRCHRTREHTSNMWNECHIKLLESALAKTDTVRGYRDPMLCVTASRKLINVRAGDRSYWSSETSKPKWEQTPTDIP